MRFNLPDGVKWYELFWLIPFMAIAIPIALLKEIDEHTFITWFIALSLGFWMIALVWYATI